MAFNVVARTFLSFGCMALDTSGMEKTYVMYPRICLTRSDSLFSKKVMITSLEKTEVESRVETIISHVEGF